MTSPWLRDTLSDFANGHSSKFHLGKFMCLTFLLVQHAILQTWLLYLSVSSISGIHGLDNNLKRVIGAALGIGENMRINSQ
ncbi:uncharacterized protein LOC125552190 isoform X4 [Triticum urartu]|uniref:uncharacterized protein LOC125552190 isoform X4 n=1 Tax=Triticum urartu TaxID=4572 RepID=UPI002043C9DB|nr:uncharacterized protein LOC125552190 isoform X4 [Triticum urartu]